MAGFTPANPLGWAPKDPVLAAQLNHLDQQLVQAVNGVGGGAYDGPLQLSDVELMPGGAGGIHGAGKIDTTGIIKTDKAVTGGVVKGAKIQPDSALFQSLDMAAVVSCTLDFTAFDHFIVELFDTNTPNQVAVLPQLVFNTATPNPDREVKRGARFEITFVADAGQLGGIQLGPNAWPASVRFRSKTDRLLDGSDNTDLTTFELVNRGTPQQPEFDVVGVHRGSRT